jgi:hypothetical protein
MIIPALLSERLSEARQRASPFFEIGCLGLNDKRD